MDIRSSKAEYINRPVQVLHKLVWPLLSRNKDYQVILPWQVPLKINPYQNIGKSIFTLGVYDLIVSEALNLIINDGDHVLDIGANIGYMTNLMSVKCGKNGVVHSFEPHPGLIEEYLKVNIQLLRGHGIKNIKLYETALSDRTGLGQLYIPIGFGNNDGIASLELNDEANSNIVIQTSTLDAILPSNHKIKLAKVDVEGHEFSVFKGASNLMSTGCIENIVYEEHTGITSDASVHLHAIGYEIFKLNRSINGVILSHPDDESCDLPYEPVNYLATQNPMYIKELFTNKGWSIYKLKYIKA